MHAPNNAAASSTDEGLGVEEEGDIRVAVSLLVVVTLLLVFVLTLVLTLGLVSTLTGSLLARDFDFDLGGMATMVGEGLATPTPTAVGVSGGATASVGGSGGGGIAGGSGGGNDGNDGRLESCIE